MRLQAEQTRGVVAALGTAQTIAWASTYYLPAILAKSISRDIGVSSVTVFTAFSGAMILSALLGPRVGRTIDLHGGRGLLLASNGLFMAGLLMLSMVTEPVMLFVSWLVIGMGMGIGLYEAAFASLAAIYRGSARNVITGITLVAGFASTIGWPLSAFLEAHYGWRGCCVVWAAIHLFVAVPLNFLLPDKAKAPPSAEIPTEEKNSSALAAEPASDPPRSLIALLSLVFAAGWFNSTSMASHLPRLLEANGATLAVAIAAGALIGPSQVAARLFEYSFMQRFHPLVSARVSVLCHPAGVALLILFGGPAAYAFATIHGAGAGMMTIAKGTLPLALIGPGNYGYWQGIISLPGRFLQAFAPILFGFAIDRLGANALWLTAGFSLVAFCGLMLVSRTYRK